MLWCFKGEIYCYANTNPKAYKSKEIKDQSINTSSRTEVLKLWRAYASNENYALKCQCVRCKFKKLKC